LCSALNLVIGRTSNLGVVPGLDPGIHRAAKHDHPYSLNALMIIMDRRVKPGDDGGAKGCASALTHPPRNALGRRTASA
jgi:hypothetical protein